MAYSTQKQASVVVAVVVVLQILVNGSSHYLLSLIPFSLTLNTAPGRPFSPTYPEREKKKTFLLFSLLLLIIHRTKNKSKINKERTNGA
ncbi:hypothetical protein BDB00DRAFT_807004 [Zychaea mexicana]|uniref:uncharacterized protein n=1 Tax=Zychaea mexicana TaxID=64656 RepID=UPI0022FDC661|nr:uncharacterized protein BDB00DRAFT_807004 [Zychaea mexicana]KAI9496752.1 hypothetical protein BDB00DRAFT_807004 [Zychaea mexicana]